MLNCTGYNAKECNSCLDMLLKKVTLPSIVNISMPVHKLTAVQTLKRAPKRVSRMRRQLNSWYTPIYYLDDLDHRDISANCHQYCTTVEFCQLGSTNKDQRSMYAIYYANVLLARAALANGITQLLVIEDDVLFSGSLMQKQIRTIESSLPFYWEYVAIGCSDYKERIGTLKSGMSPCSRVYLVARAGIRKIAHAIPMARPIDYALLDIFHDSNDVYTLSSTPIRHGSFIHRRPRGVDF